MKVIDFKNASCKHCYKCVRSCSVKAIKVRDAQATIMDDHCVLCGTCLEVCPQNAKTFVSDLEKVRAFITMGEKEDGCLSGTGVSGHFGLRETGTGGRCPSKTGIFRGSGDSRGGSLCDRGLYKASGSRTDEEHHFHLLSKCQ